MLTEQEIMEKAYKRYGTDIHSFGQQRDGYVEGYTAAMKTNLEILEEKHCKQIDYET